MSTQPQRVYEFGPFRLDTVKRVLLREGEPVPLTSKVFDTLLVLVQHDGQLLTKDELMQTLWPDSIVEESNLTQNISVLRKALGESPEAHRYIVTVPGRGYKFVASVSEVGNESADLIVTERAQAWTVVEEDVSGKEQGNGGVGESETKSISPASSTIHPFAHSPIRPFLIIGLVGLAAALSYVWMRSPSQPTEPMTAVKSIAVLPFKPLRADKSEEYLGLGMADTLITKLSNLRQLIVRPTSAMLKYTNPQQDPVVAGREQKVDAVLEGSLQRSGEKIRVTVRLLSVKDGRPLWAYQCDEQHCTDIFAVQDSISEQVVGALALKFTGEEKQRLTKHYTENTEAYQEYLKGRFHMLQYTRDGFKNSVAHLNQAIELDPTYALAYAGLADAYTTASNSYLAPREALAKAQAAALKALSFDDKLAEAYAALGHAKFHGYDWSAEKDLQRALELNPNSVSVLLWYGEYWQIRDPIKAIPILQRAQQLDPLSLAVTGFLSDTFISLRQVDQAIKEAQKVIELDPNNPGGHRLLAGAYALQRNYPEAIRELNKAKQLGSFPWGMGPLGYLYAMADQRDEARQVLAELSQLAKERFVSAYAIASVYVGLGEKDQAFAWLEKAYEVGDETLGFMRSDFTMDPLRSDPRYAALMQRLGLGP